MDRESYFESENDEAPVIFIENAGLVLLNAFYPDFLKRLGLLPITGKPDTLMREKGTLALQYVLLDFPNFNEEYLVLNKLLMGLELDHFIGFEDFAPVQKTKVTDTVHGMIKAVIAHWPAIGKSSVEGFRANWLYRKGRLELGEEQWELHVERQSYDLLMGQLPFGISPVNYSWMKKPLTVHWQ